MNTNDAGKNAFPDGMEEMRRAVLAEMLAEAVFDGWTLASLDRAGRAAGLSLTALSRGDLKLAFPGGIADVLDFWAEQEDNAMAAAFALADPAPAKIRDKVRFLVKTRIEGLTEHREAARRAAATLSLPLYGALATRLTWRTADAIWRALGDTSTDFNHYTKRTTLSAVYLSTLATWFAQDETEEAGGFEKTWNFLDQRIENVMQFEKLKAKVTKALPDPGDLIGALAKMRYRG